MENTTVVNQPEKKKNKYLIPIILIVVLICGLVTAIFLVQKNQNIQEKASVATGVAKVRISPVTKTLAVGEELAAKIYFDSGGRAISALTIQLSYSFSGSTPPISADDLIEIDSNLVLDSSWNFPIKTVTSQNGKTIIKIGGYNNSDTGYTSSGEVSLATITFKGESAGSINVTFDTSASLISQKEGAQDILLTPSSSGEYTVVGATTTPTPTATSNSDEDDNDAEATATSTSSSGSTVTPKPVPVSGISFPSTLGIITGIILVVGAALLAF